MGSAGDHLTDVEAVASMTRRDLEAHAKALRTIFAVTEAMLAASGVTDALERVLDAVARLTHFPAVAFFLLNEEAQRLELVAARGFAEATLRAARALPVTGSLSGIAVRERRLVVTEDVGQDGRTEPDTRAELGKEGFTGTACVPLSIGEHVIGVMNLIYKSELGLTTRERQLVTALGRVIAIGLDGHRARADLEAARLSAQQGEQRFATTLRSIGDAVIATDVDGHVTFMNPEAERLTGWAQDEARDRPIEDVVHIVGEQTRATVESPVNKVLRDGNVVGLSDPAALLARDGTEHSVADSAAPIRDERGTVAGVVLVFHDVTDQRATETARQQAEEMLLQAQKMEAIGRLAGGIAHDFNNMLAPILAYASLLRRNLRPPDPLYEGLREIQNAAERAASLTRQLLAFSRRQVVHIHEMDLNDTVEGLEPMLRRIIGEDVDLTVRRAPEPALVLADPSQMDQVLVNLVVNARDAMPRGGRMTIETSHVSIDAGHASGHPVLPPGPYVVLSVSDTGIGMDAATRARLFEPFFTTKPAGEGTGLGLATVHGIIKQCGGHVGVSSEIGRGTTFKVYLPRGSDAAESRPEVLSERKIALRPTETVLLVEDDDMVRRAARAILLHAGYTLLEARSGADALFVCRSHTGDIHLVLTDVIMPNMDGRDLAERLRALRPDIRVLFMSGYLGDSLKRGEGVEPGIAYVQKPFTPGELSRKVRETLERRD